MRNENSKVLTELRRFKNRWANHEGYSRRTVVYLIQGRCSRGLIAILRRIFMKSHRLWINAGIITALIVLGTAGTVKAQTVSVVQTNADQSALLQSEPSVAFSVKGDLPFSIHVDDSIRYQKMDGFGASFTDSSAWLG